MLDLVVAIPVKNEERHILRSYAKALPISSDIFYFDSASTDSTKHLVRSTNAAYINVPSYVNTLAQKHNYIFTYPSFSGKLILVLHADEYIDSASVSRLWDILPSLDVNSICSLKRQSYFLGKKLSFGRSNQRALRLSGCGLIRFQDVHLDEHAVPLSPNHLVLDLSVTIIDDPVLSASDWFSKHNYYSTLEVECLFDVPGLGVSSKPLRHRLYYFLPIFARPFVLFIIRYILLLGFLDGLPGLAYQLSHSIVYRLMVDVKIFARRFVSSRES
jgi:glycosyltransferase involved in cell wall biosynthesis